VPKATLHRTLEGIRITTLVHGGQKIWVDIQIYLENWKNNPPIEVTSTPYRKLLTEQHKRAKPKRTPTLQKEDRI